MPISELSGKLATKIALDIASGAIERGSHIATQQIADRYQVSRTPVRDALVTLQRAGLLDHQANRGFFVVTNIPKDVVEKVTQKRLQLQDVYQAFAEDWLTDRLPEIVTEQSLRQKYNVTKAKLNEILARAAREGWAERKDGYGWRLLPVAKSAEAFDEIYRFRMAIEPAAMLEPSFEINRKVLGELRDVQEKMITEFASDTPPERLLQNGAEFHEELIRMSRNPFFLTALIRVNRMRRLMEYRAEVNRERIVEQSSEHLQIISLLEKGEIAEASYFMRRHLGGALKRKSPIAWNWSDGAKGGSEARAGTQSESLI